MAGTRTVYRGSRGRFAGAKGGKAEQVKTGGFAHPGFQARFQASRAARAKGGQQAAPPVRQAARSRSVGRGSHRVALGQKVKGAVTRHPFATGAAVAGGFYVTRAVMANRSSRSMVNRGPQINARIPSVKSGGLTAGSFQRLVNSGPRVAPSANSVFAPSAGSANRGASTRRVFTMKSGVGGRPMPAGPLGRAVKNAAAPVTKVQPNYSAVKGTKEYVGRRVTDGNYGFVLKAGKK